MCRSASVALMRRVPYYAGARKALCHYCDSLVRQ
jgi:hypothetical protein